MIELTEEYKVAAKEFRKTFGYGVPLSMIPPTTETLDLILKVKECVENKTDNLLERYNVSVKSEELI